MLKRTKIKTYEVLESIAVREGQYRIFSYLIMTLIVLNVIAVVCETVDPLYDKYQSFFDNFELFSVIVFTTEYCLHVWSCNVSGKYRHRIWGRIKFMLTPLALVDLIAILPFYLPLISPDLRFIRALRLFRLFRLLKMTKYSQSLRMLLRVIKNKKEDLLVTVFVVGVVLVMGSSIIYYVENNVQPDKFPHIPAALWWGVVTLTTVGYGDVYPITPLGKFLGAIVALLGIGIFALPAGIIASGFNEEMQKRQTLRNKTQPTICPHCGKEIEDNR